MIQSFFSAPKGSRGPASRPAASSRRSASTRSCIVTAVDRLGERPEDLIAGRAGQQGRSTGLGYSARLRNYCGPQRGGEPRALRLARSPASGSSRSTRSTASALQRHQRGARAADDGRRRPHLSLAPAAAGTLQVVHPAGRGACASSTRAIRASRPAGTSRASTALLRGPDARLHRRLRVRALPDSAGGVSSARATTTCRTRRPTAGPSTPARGISSCSRVSSRSSWPGTSGVDQSGGDGDEPPPAAGDVRARPAQAASLLTDAALTPRSHT